MCVCVASVQEESCFYIKKQFYLQTHSTRANSHKQTPSSTLLQTHSYKHIPTSKLLQVNSYKHTPTNTFLLAHFYKHTSTSTLLQAHYYSESDKVTQTHPYLGITSEERFCQLISFIQRTGVYVLHLNREQDLQSILLHTRKRTYIHVPPPPSTHIHAYTHGQVLYAWLIHTSKYIHTYCTYKHTLH